MRRPSDPRGVAGALALLALAASALFLGRRAAAPPPAASPAPPRVVAPGAPQAHGAGERLVLAAAGDPDPAGTLRLEGQVIDDGEEPVEGAVVTLSTRPPRATRSDPSGGFVFEGVPGAQLSLTASRDDRSAGPVTVVVTARVEPVILRLAAVPAVNLKVLRAGDHRPVPDAAWEARGESTIVVAGSTGPDGRAALRGLPADTYTLAVWAEGYARTFQRLALGRDPLDVEVLLAEGLAAAGVVVDALGAPVAGARVVAEATASSDLVAGAGPDRLRDAVTTDGRGRFELGDLTAGTYRFTALSGRHAPGATPAVVVDGRHQPRELRIVLGPGGVVAGKVVDRAGAPAPWASVRVDDGSRRLRHTIADALGAFQMTGLPAAPVRLVALAPDSASAELAVDLARTLERRDLVLRLDHDGVIAGVVVNDAGDLVPQAAVTAVPDMRLGNDEAIQLHGLASDVSDGAGRFRLGGMGRGPYRLHAAAPGAPRRPLGWSDDADPVARAGDLGVRLMVRAPGTIAGRVLLPDGTAPSLFLVGVTVAAPSPFQGRDGKFRLEGVEPGVLDLSVSGPGFQRTVVERVAVAAGRATDVGTITVRAGRTISGRVLDPAGVPVAGAKVIAGPRLIGNGAELTTETWGNPGATASAESGEGGVYALHGVTTQDVAVAADAEVGRSAVVKVPRGPQAVQLDLVLQPQGAIEGKVTRGGKPAPDVAVNASARQAATSAYFVVRAGADGAFRFDRLAMDSYVVSVMQGATPISGITMSSTAVVDVRGGETARVDFELDDGTTQLSIEPRLPGGGIPQLSEIHVLSGRLEAQLSRQVHTFAAEARGGFSGYVISITGKPATMRVPPGDYTLCVIPYPSALAGRTAAAVRQYAEQYGDALPAFCAPLSVAREPAQAVTIAVLDPPLEPGGDPQPR